ncbi:hypothetical protein LCGC14_0697270 [marine sediment metagenome]|uniref:Uncharacterized protein n=1 Tax=marine sediment metagenome TaxID=412755 RepID=A0A0F9R463_9ZZZZ
MLKIYIWVWFVGLRGHKEMKSKKKDKNILVKITHDLWIQMKYVESIKKAKREVTQRNANEKV